MSNILDLKETFDRNKGKLSAWERDFMTDILTRVRQNPEFTLSEKQAKIIARIAETLKGVRSGVCDYCTDGWVIYWDDDSQNTIAVRCDCSGGADFVASQYRQTGREDLAQSIADFYRSIKTDQVRYRRWGIPTYKTVDRDNLSADNNRQCTESSKTNEPK